MGVVPIYAFLRHLGKMPNFHDKNSATCHLTFTTEIRLRFALGDTDCDNHTGKGRQVYMYIHHAQCKHTKSKVNTCIPRAWPKNRCRKVNRSRHTLEMMTNGTWHDILNTTHLREKGGRKEGILKSTKPKGKG